MIKREEKRKQFWSKALSAGVVLAGAFALNGNVAKAAGDVAINETNFPDPIFRDFIGQNYDLDSNNILEESEIEKVVTMICGGEILPDQPALNAPEYFSGNIDSVKGIEYFTNLKELICACNDIEELDISKNTALEKLNCSYNKIKGLDLSHNPNLKELNCTYNPILYLDITECPYLVVAATEGISQEFSGGPLPPRAITTKQYNIYNDNMEVKDIYVISYPKGIDVRVGGEAIPDVVIDEIFPDETFRKYIRENFDGNEDGSLNANEIGKIQYIDCSGTAEKPGDIKSLKGIEYLTYLVNLNCDHNQIDSLDVSKNTYLTILSCCSNPLTELKLAENGPSSLECYDCKLETLDLTKSWKTEIIYAQGERTVDGDVVTYYIPESEDANSGTVKLDKDVKVLSEKKRIPDSIAFANSSAIVTQGQPIKLEVVPTPEGADTTVEWISSDENVVTVDCYGEVTFVNVGKATITARVGLEGSPITATCEITALVENNDTNPFADVSSTIGWEYEFVKNIFDKKIMNGKGELIPGKILFAPNDTITRAEFAQLLYNKEGKPEVTIQNKFSDVEAGKWYTDAILWANEKGIVAGKGADLFGVNDPATREQIAVMLQHYAEFKGADANVAEGKGKNVDVFEDKDQISDWALGSIKWALSYEIMVGKAETKLDPKGIAKRSECAALVTHFMENFEK